MPQSRKRKVAPIGIPSGARELVTERYPNGSKKRAEYFVRGRKAGFRYWWESGQIDWEHPIRRGASHGVDRRWHANGQLMSQTSYRYGNEHGVARQWNPRGKLLGRYRMRHGTGVDRWWDDDGRLAEERHYRNGRPHGLERWWWNRRWLSEERHWRDGVLHGIWREWREGKLWRGFPRFYLNGKRVTRARYLRAVARDPCLPPYDPKEDRPLRKGWRDQTTSGARRG